VASCISNAEAAHPEPPSNRLEAKPRLLDSSDILDRVVENARVRMALAGTCRRCIDVVVALSCEQIITFAGRCMSADIGTGSVLFTRRTFLRGSSAVAGALAFAPLFGSLASTAQAAQSIGAQSTLLVYTNTKGLATGDFSHVATVGMLQDVLATFPSNWLVSGVGATDWEHSIGEVLPGGMAGDLPIWWADPDSPSQSALVDLRNDARGPTAHFPFLAMAIGDPAEAATFTLQDVPDIHVRIREELAARQLDIAGVQLEGDFGTVKSRVAYYWPITGFDQQAPDYVANDHFYFIDYPSASWRIFGLYTRKPELQALALTTDTIQQGLHLHGYTTGLRRAGHILGAAANNIQATVWPLSQMVVRYGALASTL
jgi:hypothetical protein